jgi:hypothetical protein
VKEDRNGKMVRKEKWKGGEIKRSSSPLEI